MRNRMTAKVLVAAAIGAAAAAAGVPAVYGTTATLVNNNNAYPLSATLNANSNIINGTLANSWSGGIVPGGAGDTININYNVAPFMNNATANVMLNNNTTVGILNLQGDGGRNTGPIISTLNNQPIIMDNGGAAQINVLSTNRAQMNLNANLQLNNDVTVTINGGPISAGGFGFTGSHNIALTSTAGKNLIIEGGGSFTLTGGVAFTQNKILLNNGIVFANTTTGNIFGNGASAGLYVAQGGTFYENQLQFGGLNNWNAPVHIVGTGYKLNGAYHNLDGIGASAKLVLDGDAWYVGSQGGGTGVISESIPGSRLYISFTGNPYKQEGIGANLHTLRGQNTYTGGTTILPYAWGGFVGTGYGMKSVDVKAMGTFVIENLANLYDAPGGLGDGSARVLLEPGFKANQINNFGNNAPGVVNPNGDFTSAGGRFEVATDFDPSTVIDTASSGGAVVLVANNSQSFDVASWGDGSLRFGAFGVGTSAVAAGQAILYTGTVSAGAGTKVLLLGDTGSTAGVGRSWYGAAPLQFESSIAAGNVAGVDIKSGVINYDNSNTYTGDTNVNYDGTLTILSGSTSQASAIKVNAAGTLNLQLGGGNVNTAITVNGGATANLGGTNGLGFGGNASGGTTVSGFDPSTVAGPANGAAMPYRGLVTYNAAGSATGGITVNSYGQVTLHANMTSFGSDVVTLNDLGVLRGLPAQFDAVVGTSALVINPGAVLYNNVAAAGNTLPASFTTTNLGTLGDKYYGIGNNGANAVGLNWTIGATSGGPWKGLAGGADGNDITVDNGNSAGMTITLSGSADLVGLANGLGSSDNAGGGTGNSVGGNSLTVNHKITGILSGSDKLTIRGGGNVVFNNNTNDFTAPVVIDAAQLSADLGAWDSYLGDPNNTITLKNGGKLLIGTGVTLPAARTITVDTGGGAIGVGGNTTAPQVLTIGTASQLTGSTKFTKYGNGTLDLTADTGLTGPVSVVGGTLKLTDPTAIQNATSLTLGIAQQALVSPFLNVASAGFPVANVVSGNFGALLLDKATLDAGTYKLNGGTMTLANVPLNGGAIGFTGDAALTFAGLNLGTQTVVSSLSVKPIENDALRYTGIIQGAMQSVKLLHLGGYSPNATGVMTFTDAITDSGGPVLLMKGGHNVTLDLTGSPANTYTGGTYIYDGEVKVSNANQLGSGAIELTGAYGTNAAGNNGILHITDNVTFGANQFFRFQGSNTAVGTPLGGSTTYAPYINVDSGKTAIINNIDQDLTSGGQINKIGAGTLKVNIAQNMIMMGADGFSAYIGGGTLELDSLPASLGGGNRYMVFDNGTLTVHAPPAAAEYGSILNSSGYGFTRQYVRDGTTNTVNIDSGAMYVVRSGGGEAWDGTLVINGADSTSEAMFAVANGTAATTSGNGVLDIHGGRVAVINDNTSGGNVIPWNNAAFTVKLQGGELDGNDFQNSNARTTLPSDFINANVAINSTYSAPIIGGAYPTTLAGAGTTSWVGLLTKNGSGILTFNRNGAGAFTSDATTALTINGGQVVIDGYGAFDSATFQANHVPIINNSLTDTGSDAGVVFQNTTGDLANDIRYVDSITGSGGIQVNGVMLHIGASPSVIDAGVLRLTTNAGLGGRLRLDGDLTFSDPFDATAVTTPSRDVTLHANVATALSISTESTLMAHDVTLANTSTGGVLSGTLIAHSLSINGNSASFTQNAGSILNLNGVTTINNNGAFTYNGGTTDMTAITGLNASSLTVNAATLLIGAPGTITQGALRLVGSNLRNDNSAANFSDPFNSATAGAVNVIGNSNNAFSIDATSSAKLGEVTLSGNSTGGILNGTLVAHGLTISSANGTFTQNAGSSLTLDPAITNNGTYTFNGGSINPAGAVGINSTTPTGQLVLNANLALSEVRQSVKVQVNSGSVLTLTASGGPTTGGTDANVSRMGSLVLSGAADAWTSKLDVNDNKVIIDNANSAVAAATYTQTNNQLKQGFDNGAWDGQGIVSTKAQTNVNNGVPVTIGVINNDDGSGNPAFFHDGTDLPQFGGQNVNGTAVLTKYTYFGDADLSGTVDAVDYTFFVAGVQSGGTLTGWEWGDFDYSGTIDAVDYTFFVFGVQGQGAALAGGGSGPTSVPEPASLALLGLGGLLMLKRRNRKS